MEGDLLWAKRSLVKKKETDLLFRLLVVEIFGSIEESGKEESTDKSDLSDLCSRILVGSVQVDGVVPCARKKKRRKIWF